MKSRVSRYGRMLATLGVGIILGVVIGVYASNPAGPVQVAQAQESSEIVIDDDTEIPDDPNQGNLEAVLEKLARMNRIIARTIRRYEAEEIEEAEVRRALSRVWRVESSMLEDDFPRIFGTQMVFWVQAFCDFRRLRGIAFTVSHEILTNEATLVEWLEAIKRRKESIEEIAMRFNGGVDE
jgi:hypothetical protein